MRLWRNSRYSVRLNQKTRFIRHAVNASAPVAERQKNSILITPGDTLQSWRCYTVIVTGRNIGRDPDPNVRLMLRRDPMTDAS